MIDTTGKFICPDSIRCGDRSQPIAVGFLIDRSGSMGEKITPNDPIVRMDASKAAVNRFINKMQAKDEAMIVSFSSDVQVNQTWTSDTTLLKKSINSIFPFGSTAFNQALVNAIDSVRKNANPRKAIIALTDGANNLFPNSDSVFKKLREVKAGNLPIYVIALGLDTTNIEDKNGLDTLKMIADSSKGKLYKANNSAALDSIYVQLNKDIAQDQCCTIYFKITPCKDKSDSVRTVTILFPLGDSVVMKTVQYRTDCAQQPITHVKDDGTELRQRDPFDVGDPNPNPNQGRANIDYEIPISGNVLITIVDELGRSMKTIFNEPQEKGRYSIELDTRGLAAGVYRAVISLEGIAVSRTMVVAK